MGRINKLPIGLLSALESKTDGRYPDSLSEEVRAILDLTELYLANRLAPFTTAPQNIAPGNGAFFEVPDDELLILVTATLNVTFGTAADSIAGWWGIERHPFRGSLSGQRLLGQVITATPHTVMRSSLVLPQYLILTSGMRLVWFTDGGSIAGPNPTASITGNAYVLTV